jgi:hypothetical protein
MGCDAFGATGYHLPMKFFPYGVRTLRPMLDAPEVERRLGEVVDTRKKPALPLGFSFWGRLDRREFRARYVGGLGGLRPIQPEFVGTIVPTPDGSELRLRIRIHLPGTLFLFVWFGFFLLMAWNGLHDGLTRGWDFRSPRGRSNLNSPRDVLIVAGCFLLGGYATLVAQFWAEARRGIAALEKALHRVAAQRDRLNA